MTFEDWSKRYVDTLLDAARTLGDTAMGHACLIRAGYAMDLVEAWRKHDRTSSPGSTPSAPWTCPVCGPHVKVDEDGCAACGEDASHD